MLKRKRNVRSTWNVNLVETIAGNYYPVPTKISLRDDVEQLKLTILTDRSEGGSSLKDGQLETMVQSVQQERVLHFSKTIRDFKTFFFF